MRAKGLLDIYILEILANHSSMKYRLKQKDIMHYLEEDYNIQVNRNTLSTYLEELKEYGYIAGDRGVYLVRKFSNSEIKLLINTIIYSKSIPSKDIHNIVCKLKDIAEPELRKNLRNVYYIDNMDHTENKNVCDIIETIDQAIQECKKIEITSCKYDVKGKLVETGTRIIDPYYIVAEKSRYYLLCYAGRLDIEPRRIDRISKVRILKEKRLDIKQIEKYKNYDFSIADYMREHIYMYSGENERITIKVKMDNIGDVIDSYGSDYRIVKVEEPDVIITIKANSNAVYFWALQYGGIAEIIKPVELRNRIKHGLEDMLEKYKKT